MIVLSTYMYCHSIIIIIHVNDMNVCVKALKTYVLAIYTVIILHWLPWHHHM